LVKSLLLSRRFRKRIIELSFHFLSLRRNVGKVSIVSKLDLEVRQTTAQESKKAIIILRTEEVIILPVIEYFVVRLPTAEIFLVTPENKTIITKL